MSVHDPRAWERPQPRPANPIPYGLRRLAPSWRWLSEAMWWVEHSFGRARANARPEEDTRVRIFLITTVFSVIFCALALGAANAALLKPKGAVGSVSNPNAVSRGDIVDRNGALMATNVTHYSLYVNPNEVWDPELAAQQIRRALPRVSASKLRNVLDGRRRLLVLQRLTPEEKAAVHGLALGGVTFEPEDLRIYPLEGSARHVLGASDTGAQGISGAELAFNNEIRAAGQNGGSFPLSIDLRVQGVLDNELAAAASAVQAHGAVGVVADATTGEILGMSSWPTTDSKNLVTSGHYEMGSVFKTFTIAASLDTGKVDMNTMFDASQPYMIGNRRITDFHATNKILSLEEVYLHSSNIGTSRMAVELGSNTMRDYFQRLGLLEAAPIELHESARPRLPRNWEDSSRASMSFGYAIMITPLQMTAATVALVNGGMYRPLTLRRGGTGVEGRRVVSAETSRAIRDLMRANVLRGSGKSANAQGLRVGGKTGSANKLVNGRYDPRHGVGSFASVFPADGGENTRRYVIFVLIDEPAQGSQLGGAVAAPTAGRVIDRISGFLNVERVADPIVPGLAAPR
ncbi:peptidoglycan D,D-transpeptidase FtsI family protein [Brevundimonas sp. GCM10030266]|uniref:peptidoglycan D,D-transpeptidase FtsI family protein n=1 Tax=Brevundimonas sp. GCM10030266 TaxID=3273386 RepID=UPI00361DE662